MMDGIHWTKVMKAAVAQVALYNAIDANVVTSSHYISQASKVGIDILCFPECTITGYVREFTAVDLTSFDEPYFKKGVVSLFYRPEREDVTDYATRMLQCRPNTIKCTGKLQESTLRVQIS